MVGQMVNKVNAILNRPMRTLFIQSALISSQKMPLVFPEICQSLILSLLHLFNQQCGTVWDWSAQIKPSINPILSIFQEPCSMAITNNTYE